MVKKKKLAPFHIHEISRKQPTPEQLKQAAMADCLYDAHSKINKVIGAAAFEMIAGTDPRQVLKLTRVGIDLALQEAADCVQGFLGELGTYGSYC